ncbi:MAG: transglutaminase domain-containing protein [Pseudomonadota bacterium]
MTLPAKPAPEAAETPRTYSISDPAGTVIGTQSEQQIATPESITHTRIRTMSFTIDGHEPIRQDIAVSFALTAENGAPLSYSVAYEGSKGPGSYAVRIVGELATIIQERGETRREYSQAIKPGIPLHDPELIGTPAPGRYYTFDIARGRLVERTSRSIALPQGNLPYREAVVTYDRGSPISIWLAQRAWDGRLIAMIRPQVGSRFSFIPVADGAEPPKPKRSGQIPHPMLESPNVISQSARKGHIRYRIEMLAELAGDIPTTPEQLVKQQGSGVQIDVCAQCGAGFANDPASLERWRQPSPWIQSDHPPIAKAAARGGKRDISDADKMRFLARIARQRLKDIDLNGHYSARSAWERRAGDCTEDAVLLAALARAAGIPARVASGLAYTRERYHGTRNAFIPHAWVIVYLDGQWRSYDMTTPEGFGAGHIALSINDGEAHRIAGANLIAGMIEWESLSLIRKRPMGESEPAR